MLLADRRARIVLQREAVRRPHEGAPPTFVCPGCDVVLWDAVVYSHCPMCDLPVDWVDLSLPVWCCPGCDLMYNAAEPPSARCAACDMPLVCIDIPPPPRGAPPAAGGPPASRLRRVVDGILAATFLALMLAGAITPLLSMALEPRWRYLAMGLAAPVLLLPMLWGGLFIWTLGASFRELSGLARHRTMRVIHGLEHAAAKILERDGAGVLGGLTHPGYFELHFMADRIGKQQARVLRRAVIEAIRRLREGERSLALHPLCGTSMLVTALLLSLMALASGIVGLVAHLQPQTLLGVGAGFVLLVVAGSRPLGMLAQRLFTVSTRFRSARVTRIVRHLTRDGAGVCYAVHLHVH